MIIERIELTVIPGREVQFEGALVEARQHVFMARGFRGLDVARGVERPSVYLIQVRWETVDDLVAFGESELFHWWSAPLRPFLADSPTVEPFQRHPSLCL